MAAVSAERVLRFDGIEVVVRVKAVRNLNLRIKAPEGRVELSVPRRTTLVEIADLIARRRNWILDHQRAMAARAERRTTSVGLCDGAEVLVFGVPHRLCVRLEAGTPSVQAAAGDVVIRMRPSTPPAVAQALLDGWYRAQMRARVRQLAAHWEPLMGVSATSWVLRRMRSRWGSCATRSGRICLNLELARRPGQCLEYVVVHELAHLIEPSHNARFWATVERHLPDWRTAHEQLKQGGL